ncbi:hydrolase [Pilimelia terevasa]|uniref:Hydrolase n=1 Tax=Pilimelia terevasa TaxID=53372 RepID=A0A8J3FGU7_9ACTN|nr:nitrilase-related carbon-nitrogen hydrolase [Pilimelia terevasa]GGK23584.1 hydrolase [Pilimelia terevasa]
MAKWRVSLVQLDVDLAVPPPVRRARAAALVRAQAGADLVVLPELWPVGAFAAAAFAAAAEDLTGPTASAMAAAAADAGVWLHAGSLVEAAPDGRRYNTALLFGPDGRPAARYRKIHRFGFDAGEARVLAGGRDVVTARLPALTLGLSTCYDLRFPELFRRLLDAGAEALVVTASWPRRRLAHWRALLCARAIENQAYVLACNAAGTHAGVPQAGHSMVVDPWGRVVAEAGAPAQVLTAVLDPAAVVRTRAEFPVLRDRVLDRPPT